MIFIFEGCVLFYLLLQTFGVCQSQLHFSNVFYYYYIPTGHLQVEYMYWLIPKELFYLQQIHCPCFGYQFSTHIFLFWRFCRLCMDVVDMIPYYYCYIFKC
jgi:hypothetical protein